MPSQEVMASGLLTPYSQERIGTDLNDRDYIQNALLNGKASVGKPIIARPYETPVIAMAAIL